jgi:hypothetical protein
LAGKIAVSCRIQRNPMVEIVDLGIKDNKEAAYSSSLQVVQDHRLNATELSSSICLLPHFINYSV